MTRLATCAAAIAAAILFIGADTVPDPLAPAHSGMVQCYDPHTDVKTCRAIGAYSFESDGTIQNEATVALPDGRDTLIGCAQFNCSARAVSRLIALQFGSQ